MIKAVITDFSKVLLFAKDPTYQGGLNALNHQQLAADPVYPFLDYFQLNDELLRYYSDLNRTLPVYVFTSETVQDHPAIKTQIETAVTGVYSAKLLGLSKTDPRTYQTISQLVHAQPDQIIYVDDKPANVEAAAAAGLNAILYQSNGDIITKLDTLLKHKS